MNQGELHAHLEKVLGEQWRLVWPEINAHRRESLRALQDAAGELFRQPGISEVRFRIELEYIVRLIAEYGP